MNENNSNEVRLKKIPLKRFIDALIDIYTSGAEYIDLVGESDKEQDSIGIVVNSSYMSTDDNEYYKELSDRIIEKAKKGKLSEEDLNELT